ncbi:MAG TPA: cobaltochelatase subunit CobN, partial [Acetobacteraceae bacterium]|nr:cobaltochelatase subunit CobN [Acetobacteraceae bacterium]
MHLLFRETRSLDEEARAVDLGQAPADLVFLSFSDSDLGAAAASWQARGPERPSLRLANLEQLRHPMSVDLYAEQVIARARAVIVRLLGGIAHWRYGIEEIGALCRREGIPLAALAGDDRDDPRLAELSTVPGDALSRLDLYFRHGGPDNVGQALALAAQVGGIGGGPTLPPSPLPRAGVHALPVPEEGPAGLAVVVFYRSHLLAGDIAPIAALAGALRARGLGVRAIHVASLKDAQAAAFVAERLRQWRPSVVLNATGFSARQNDAASPLDVAGVPVLQLVLSGVAREAWETSTRGLSQADLAMQVVLPELDGRLLTTAIAFKTQEAPIPGLEYARTVHRPDTDGIALAAERAIGWARLARTPRAARRVAIVLSDYPGAGAGQVGHAVGLDSLASLEEIARLLRDTGYTVDGYAGLAALLCDASPVPILDLATYRCLLPAAIRAPIENAWGAPENDAA